MLRTFAQSRRYIFIDEKDIKEARNFLLNLQKPNGCFREIGMVHHKEMIVSFRPLPAFSLIPIFNLQPQVIY